MTRKTSRRTFLKTTALGVAAPMILPSGVLAAPGRPGANDRINFGLIGCGRRGRQILPHRDDSVMVGFADVNQARLDEMKEGHPEAATFLDYREMLAMPELDAVLIATPDHWHTLPAIHACEAGKDIYIEKPMTLTIAEGRALVKAARKHGRIVQVGSQQRSTKECRIGCELVRNGRVGRIHTVHGSNYPSPWECALGEQPVPEGLNWDVWCGQTEPRAYHIDLYLPRAQGRADALGRLGWISFRPYSGGEITGWGAHGLDIIQWALGTELSCPVEVWPEGEGLTCPITYRYADGTLCHLDNKGPGGGGVFEGDEGSILVDRGKYEVKPETVSSEPVGEGAQRLYESNDHMGNFVDCMRSRELPIADVEIGHRSTTMCHLGNIARWTGRKLRWDPVAERFENDDEANGLLSREGRAPYAVPTA